MREKRLPFLGGELVVRLRKEHAQRIRQTLPYRLLLGPVIRRLKQRNNNNGLDSGDSSALDLAAEKQAVPVFLPRPEQLPQETSAQRSIVERVSQRQWYHTIDLGNGILTPGFYDHTPALDHFPLPRDLSGKRCLDVASFDGFWAFEMERRGATEVVALDIGSWADLDLPPYYKPQLLERVGTEVSTGRGFKLAAEVLKSRVERRICNIYDLSPEVFGQFDIVFCSDILIHITNPLRAIQNIYAVTKGEAIFMEPYLPGSVEQDAVAVLYANLEDCHWWAFGKGYLAKAARASGFSFTEIYADVDIRMRTLPTIPAPRIILRALKEAPVAAIR